MPQFNYEGLNKYGDRVRGILLADNEVDLRIKLRRQNIRPSKIEEEKIFQSKTKVLTEEERFLLIKELSVMLSNGLTSVQAMSVLESTAYTKNIRILSARIRTFMEHGNSFSQAVAQYPEIFDELFLNVVAVGELKGTLDRVLVSWIKFKETESKLNSLTSRAIFFPLVILFSFLIVFSLVTLGLEPLALKYYNGALPILVSKSLFIMKYSAYAFFTLNLLVLSLGVPIYLIFGKEKITKYLKKIFIKLPLISTLLKKYLITKAILILKFTLSLDFPIKRSLHLVALSMDESTFEEVFLQAKEAAHKKEKIAPILARSSLFPMILVQMMSVGEVMGNLQTTLGDIFSYLEKDLSDSSKTISNFLEPLVLILGGVIVGVLATMLIIPLVLNMGVN